MNRRTIPGHRLGGALALPAGAPILDKQSQLEAQTFWGTRDWDWHQANIPFFECPDAEITTTYCCRRVRITYGSPASG